MYLRLTTLILRWLRVPPEPHPPHGDPASLRVFRAGKNFLNLRLFGWGLGQAVAAAGIIFWLVVFIEAEHTVQQRRAAHQTPVQPLNAKNFSDYVSQVDAATNPDQTNLDSAQPGPKPQRRSRTKGFAGFKQLMVELAMWLPPWSFPLIWMLKLLGILLYLAQIPVTYAIRRLDYEMRWYMVTDRSLRIRHGVWHVSESTMSFANIQQVVVTQDPVQRLLGLADVKAQSAGGGGGGDKHNPQRGDDMHLGLFHGVTNANEIRDLILARLRRFRESGLGDPDEKIAPPPVAEPASPADLLVAARELAAEARALRMSLS